MACRALLIPLFMDSPSVHLASCLYDRILNPGQINSILQVCPKIGHHQIPCFIIVPVEYLIATTWGTRHIRHFWNKPSWQLGPG